jgi:hypothetical protein
MHDMSRLLKEDVDFCLSDDKAELQGRRYKVGDTRLGVQEHCYYFAHVVEYVRHSVLRLVYSFAVQCLVVLDFDPFDRPRLLIHNRSLQGSSASTVRLHHGSRPRSSSISRIIWQSGTTCQILEAPFLTRSSLAAMCRCQYQPPRVLWRTPAFLRFTVSVKHRKLLLPSIGPATRRLSLDTVTGFRFRSVGAAFLAAVRSSSVTSAQY